MLKRVSIQNFKSLKDVTLDLQKVNLLIGPNNSGKTNFLKALEYMDKDNTNQSEPEYERLIFRPSESSLINIELFYDHTNEYNVQVVFTCQIGSTAQIERSRDLIQNDQRSNGTKLHYNPEDLKQRLRPIIIYKPDPNKLIQPGHVATGEEIVNSDASNLVGFLDRMLGNKYRKSVFNKIETDLYTCVPEFDEISLDDVSVTEELRKQFGDKSLKRIGLTNSKLGVTYWADELSEGTLYFLALLCIINQPNPPKLLLLEEPEKGIHPRRIEEVINFIFGLADDKGIQVIMTTHSPAVVDMFKDMPESVFIFDKDEEGATHVKNLQLDIIEPETAESKKAGFDPPQYLNGLGEAWKVGFIGGVPR
ncbi:AAA family ATPase [Spirosoma panaciterrae]|uniref:AAA family ATPase n=1 Tax=Spirosoma panaciterrae TaxID=496058 RepID=UPI0003768BB2|nr:ATP-binding protein [Spirosoma panaciterrae]